MNLPHLLLPRLVLLAFALAGPAFAEEARMVADLATGSAPRGSGGGPMLVVDQGEGRFQVYYAADDGRHGTELWVTETDAQGRRTRLVADLCPGLCSSFPEALTLVGERVFFFADDGLFDRALFTTGGTNAKTSRLAAMRRSYQTVGPQHVASLNGQFVFAHPAEGSCTLLWASDGTPAGTRPLEQGCPRTGLPGAAFVPTASGLFFTSYNEMWRVQPSPSDKAGFTITRIYQTFDFAVELGGELVYAQRLPARVARFGLGSPLLYHVTGYSVLDFQRYGDLAIFGLFDHAGGVTRYWETDGTPAGTRLSPALAFTGHGPTMTLLHRAAGEPVLLFHDHVAHRLYASNMTEHRLLLENVQVQPTPLPNSTASDNANATAVSGNAFKVGNKLYHVDRDLELRLIAEVGEVFRGCATVPGQTFAADDTFYRLDPGAGLEPYLAGRGYETPTLVADIAHDDVRSSDPHTAATAGGYVSVANDGRLFALPADAGTAAMVDEGPFNWLAATGGRLFLTTRNVESFLVASTGGPVEHLGSSQVTTGNRPGTLDGTLYFTTDWEGQDVNVSDGTPRGTHLLHDAVPGWSPFCNFPPCPTYSAPEVILADAERLFWGGSYDQYDGLYTARHGDRDFTEIPTEGMNPRARLLAEGLLYFTNLYLQSEVWASDGTPAGTRRLVVLGDNYQPSPEKFAHHRGQVYFVVWTPTGDELWRTDGTPAGTGRFFDFGPGAMVGEMLPAGDHLYLSVATQDKGAELWAIADRQPYLVRDIFPGARASFPHHLHALQSGRLVFAADDGVHGAEAWISDGTAQGTRLLADLGPGAGGPALFAEREGRLVFTGDDGEHGRELWTVALDSKSVGSFGID